MPKKKTEPAPCPNCGHCPTCGHTPQRMAPVYPWSPTWYPMPYYQQPPSWTLPSWTLTTTTTETGTTWYNLDSGAGGTC